MGKIWEVDFCHTSGVNPFYYLDNIGSQAVTSGTGYLLPTPISPLQGFNVRPGVVFPSTSASGVYLDLTGKTNAQLSTTYATLQRTLELWFWTGASASWLADAYIWNDNGVYLKRNGSTTQLLLNINGSTTYFESLSSSSWKHIVVVIDRIFSVTYLYQNGTLVASGSTMPPTSVSNPRIGGGVGAANTPFMELGSAVTYDYAMSSSEVLTRYNSFLADSPAGNLVYQTVSGNVYAANGVPSSGSLVYLISPLSNQVVSMATTNVSGNYLLNLPYSGSFSVLATTTPGGYSSSYNVVATPTGVYFL
jgi:hypothetical protein